MIGFYDSGIGGVTVLDRVLQIDSDFPFIYLADTEALPLGDKGVDFIRSRVKLACKNLFNLGCELVVLVCNTASVNSIRHIQNVWLPVNFPDHQVLSITKPFTELAEDSFKHLKNTKGLLFATQATYDSGFYQYEFTKSGFVGLSHIACSGLADAIEAEDQEEIKLLIKSYISNYSLKPNEIKYIMLACTHYKWAIPEILNFFNNATIIEPSEACAEKLINYIDNHPKYLISRNTKSHFLVTSQTKSIANLLEKLNYKFMVKSYAFS